MNELYSCKLIGQRWSEFVNQLIKQEKQVSFSELAQQLLDSVCEL